MLKTEQIHSPKRDKQVTKLVAFVDTEPGEGILAMQTRFGVMPLISGNPELVDAMRESAKAIAANTGHRVEMREYHTYTVLETL